MKCRIYMVLLLAAGTAMGQDVHFSQFSAWPLNMTPGQTGVFDGNYRFAAIQRTQWRSVTTPYRTFAASIEAKNPREQENIGLGLNILHDKTGDSRYTTLQAGGAGTYRIALDADSSHSLYPGVHIAFTQRKIDYAALRFDNQYNGSAYDPNIANGEIFRTDNRIYANLHGGVHYEFNIAERKSINAGFGVSNLLRPRQSFFNDDDIVLDRRLSTYAGASIMVNEKLDALPALLVSRQGKFTEIIFGSTARYILNGSSWKYRAVGAGIWYRNKDAGYVSFNLYYDQLTAGVSYDFNLSALKPASRGFGGFEFSLIYIIKYIKLPHIMKFKACPTYI